MRALIFAICLLPVGLAGCVVTPPPSIPAGSCGADELQYLVGQPGAVLHGMRFSQEVRVIEHGMAVTMDYKSDRLNIQLDRRDVIERVTCG